MENKEKYGSCIFKEVLEEMKGRLDGKVFENTDPLDVTESIHIDMNDENIDKSECSLNAYGIHVKYTDDVFAYNFKNNPDKAIDILLNYPNDGIKIEIFLDTGSFEWNSIVNGGIGKLSPEQMECFFNSDFYGKLKCKLEREWPEKDEMFSKLRNALVVKKYSIDQIFDNSEEMELDEGKIRRRDVDKGKPNEKDAAGNKIRSSSGRKLVSFSDQGVSRGEEAYYSWPGGTDDKSIFKWSRWSDWNKQRPWVRMRFSYNVSSNGSDIIGLTLTPFEKDDENRGFKSFDLSLQPILQYLTPDETQQILGLSIVRKFIKTCIERISGILAIQDEEIYKKINRPDKCTLEDIRKTKRIFKNTMKALREGRADTFIYT